MSSINVGIEMTFDGSEILAAGERAERKILFGMGAGIRTAARRMIKKGGPNDRSTKDMPPVGHANELYRNFIAFGYEPHEVAIGSQLISGVRGDVAPEKIEYGGREVVTIGKGPMMRRVVMQFAPRPAMRLAMDEVIKKLLPKLIAKSVN